MNKVAQHEKRGKKPAVEFFTYSKSMVIFLKGFDKPFLQTNIKFIYLLKMTKLFLRFLRTNYVYYTVCGRSGGGRII